MMQVIRETSHLPRYVAIILFFLLIIGYSLFQARFLILGPRISIDYPPDGARAENELVLVQGRAQNAAWLSLNGRQIFTNEEGYWKEKLLLPQGLSIMTVTARDRFGRETEEKIRIFLN